MVISFLLLPESSCRADQLWGISITTFPGTLYLSLSVSVFASVCLCLCICLFVSLRLINYGELPSKVFLARDQWPRCLIQSTTSLKTSIFKENRRYIGKLFVAFYNFFFWNNFRQKIQEISVLCPLFLFYPGLMVFLCFHPQTGVAFDIWQGRHLRWERDVNNSDKSKNDKYLR